MKNAVKIEKLQIVENTDKQYVKKSGVIAFQMVKFTYFFYGQMQTDYLDTKIMKGGKQIVIEGNGFIKSGTEI